MPNWVENSINITGAPEDIEAFLEKAGKPRPFGENGEITEWANNGGFSFWNFIAPSQEIIDSGEYFGTSGFTKEGRVGDGAGNWYQWNNANWNTKWDACNATIDLADDHKYCSIYFSTAWSIPEPVFEAMVEQHPTLEFSMRSFEEQGWGAEFESTDDGELMETDSWDIPDSHEEWMRVDGLCRQCAWDTDDQTYWFEDCPREDLA